MSSTPKTILFAGGGTGGHIFPSLAVWERLREAAPNAQSLFVISQRPLDVQVLAKHPVHYAAISAQPFSLKPWHWPNFFQCWSQSVSAVQALIQQRQVSAVVAMGGFVSGPAVAAARSLKIPVALVNLDAVPGKANRYLARKANQLFTVYPTPHWPQAVTLGLPLRRSAVSSLDPTQARTQLGLDPARDLLFITAGSQGATSINRMMIELTRSNQFQRAMNDATNGWQLLHLTGDKDRAEVEAAYKAANLTARVLPFCETMGLAWAGSSLALSRAGANSVAEVWANAVPTIFFPYPYHKDQHQKFNAEPLTRAGMGLLMQDQIEPAANARQLLPRLLALMSNVTQRRQMHDQLRHTTPPDGAAVLAKWVMG